MWNGTHVREVLRQVVSNHAHEGTILSMENYTSNEFRVNNYLMGHQRLIVVSFSSPITNNQKVKRFLLWF